MEKNDFRDREEIFSKVLRAGRRTYFFDVRSTKQGDYFITITESKRRFDRPGYDSHKIFLYKEDFNEFSEILDEMTNYIISEKGEEVISERHQKDYIPTKSDDNNEDSEFSDVDFNEV